MVDHTVFSQNIFSFIFTQSIGLLIKSSPHKTFFSNNKIDQIIFYLFIQFQTYLLLHALYIY